MKKIEINRENKVFVFGNPNLTECTFEENALFFKESIDPLSVGISKNITARDAVLNKFDFIEDNFDKLLIHFSKNKVFYKKAVYTLALALFFSSNPTSIFAMPYMDKLSSTGAKLLPAIVVGINKGVLILTLVKLFNEYLNGCSQYRVFEILRECVAVLLATTIIPNLPLIVNILLK